MKSSVPSITLPGDIAMPILGLGTYQSEKEACKQSVLWALEAGYRLIDTAEAYENEEFVGEALAESDIARSDLFLTTKVNFTSYEHARAVVEASLEKLRVDYLDLVLLHWPFGNYYAAWRELEKLKDEGVIRAIGISNFNPDRFIDLISFTEQAPVINQIETNIYCQRHEEHTWEDTYHIAHEAYSPLGQEAAAQMFAEPIIQELATKYGKTPAQVILRFLTQLDVVVIPKSTHKNRIEENIDIFDFELDENDVELIKTLDRHEPAIGKPQDPRLVEWAMTW